jgi:hypothetical protein
VIDGGDLQPPSFHKGSNDTGFSAVDTGEEADLARGRVPRGRCGAGGEAEHFRLQTGQSGALGLGALFDRQGFDPPACVTFPALYEVTDPGPAIIVSTHRRQAHGLFG